MKRALVISHPWNAEMTGGADGLKKTLTDLGWELWDETDDAGQTADVAIVLGGDGTLLRAAELVRYRGIPLLGVNLGRLGFLAESDRDDLDEVLARIDRGDYWIEERATLQTQTMLPGSSGRDPGWALNEATIEKSLIEKMLEVAIEVDGRPITTFGCDGVSIATPTGSTGHSFSAGGPVVWPDVEALIVVPMAAHALFARPLVVSPKSTVTVEVLQRSRTPGTLCHDSRRMLVTPAGSRIDIRFDPDPVRLIRLNGEPFADRLVKKFDLPVAGWRGGREDS